MYVKFMTKWIDVLLLFNNDNTTTTTTTNNNNSKGWLISIYLHKQKTTYNIQVQQQ